MWPGRESRSLGQRAGMSLELARLMTSRSRVLSLADEREAKAVAAFRQRLNSLFDDVGDAGYRGVSLGSTVARGPGGGARCSGADGIAPNADEITVSWDVAVIWASVPE